MLIFKKQVKSGKAMSNILILPEPNELRFSARLLGLLGKVEEFRGRWQELTWLSRDVLSQLRRSATIESVGSSTRIEGSKLTDRQVETLLDGLGTEKFLSRDEEEVAGYAAAMNFVFDAADILPPSENHVLQLHSMLLKFSTKDQRHRGAYKTLANHVAAFDPDGKELGIIFKTTSPFDTPREMETLTTWYIRRHTQADLHPLLVVGIYIVAFLRIHPFQDGNGRLSRILTTLLLLRTGYTYVPFMSLEAIVEQNKDGYYRALRATQTTIGTSDANWEPWLEFFLMILWKQTVALGQKITALEASLSRLGVHERAILDLVEKQGFVTVADVMAATGALRETVRKRLGQLVKKGFLMSQGKGRAAGYRKA